MQAIVLAAGRGTRMAPLCTVSPKPVLEVAGRSLLHRLLDGLAGAGVDEAVVVVGHGKEAVRRHAKAWGPGMRLRFVDQGAPRGTGHAVAAAAGLVKEDCLLVMGDALAPAPLLATLAKARGFTLAAARVPNPQDYGALAVEGRKVKRLAEKSSRPPSDLVNTGLYRLPAEAVQDALRLKPSRRGELEFTDVVNSWAKRGVSWIPAKGWMDVGRPWDLLAAQESVMGGTLDFLLDGAKVGGTGVVEEGVAVRGRLFAAAGAVVRSGAYVEGDVHVGKGARVGPNCFLRGPLSIGAGCHVGNGCEVKASVLMPGANVPHLSYVGDSVLGEGCNLGAGTQVANLRHDGAEVHVLHRGAKASTGRRKFGAVVGDGAKTGVNASLNPGTILGANARVAAGRAVKGAIEDGAWVA